MTELAGRFRLDDTAPRRARSLLDPCREAMGDGEFLALEQIVGELVAHCVQEGPPTAEVELRVRLAEDAADVELSRAGGVDGFSASDPTAASIAFRLVDRLAERWGVRGDGERTVVWLTLPAGRPPGAAGG